MRLVLGAILRAISLLLSYALSTLSAASFLTFVWFLGSEIGWLEDPLVVGGAAIYVFSVWLIIAELVFAPVMVMFVIAEIARMRSLLMNVLGGGLCALAVLLLTPVYEVLAQDNQFGDNPVGLAIISAGFVAGFVHWIFAGSRSGNWWYGSAGPIDPRSEGS